MKKPDDMKKKTSLKDGVPSSSDRYSRQVLFGPIGIKGQEMLAKSKVIIVGCGGLGSVLSSSMTRAGTGTLRIIASIQSTEALKFLTCNIDAMIKGLINIDTWDLSLDIIEIGKDSGYICPVCGDKNV